MKLKYYLRGVGIGIIFATLVMTVSSFVHKNNISDEYIIKEARKLGMVMKEELKDEISKQTEILIERMKNDDCGIDCGKYHFHSTLELEWLLKNHFDYRGLIEKGLAIDATGKNIY